MKLHAIPYETVPWDTLNAFDDRVVMQTRPWLEFLRSTQGAEPVVAQIRDGSEVVGYFTGAVVSKFGLRVLGSPFKGWTTSFMGFNLRPGVSRNDALDALPAFAFDDLGCHHLEVMDRRLTEAEIDPEVFSFEPSLDFEIDLRQTEDEMFSNMSGSCRRCIRKARKSGVVIETVEDPTGFAAEYYSQLEDVFAKQTLVPTYDQERVEQLVQHLFPTGNLLLLRARNEDGTSIATGIFPGLNDTMYFWGGASLREHQILRPNEAIMWEAMLQWKERGIELYNMVGGGDYKKKYGSYPITVPRVIASRNKAISGMRDAAEKAWGLKSRIIGKLKTGGES